MRAGRGGSCSRRCAGAARAERDERDDILAMLERAHDADGAPMGEQKLRDELVTLLSDGPTATSLAWAFERLLRHPDKLARLRAEVLAGETRSTSTRSSRRRCGCARRCRSSCGG